jgi:hypothetical protein
MKLIIIRKDEINARHSKKSRNSGLTLFWRGLLILVSCCDIIDENKITALRDNCARTFPTKLAQFSPHSYMYLESNGRRNYE